MESGASDQFGNALIRLTKSGADSATVADEVVALVRRIEAVLVPILGRRGMAALFQRSLSVAGASHPWLAAVRQPGQDTVDIDALAAAFVARPPASAAEGSTAFFNAFHDLLCSLIGTSLTAQLLSTVSVAPHDDPSRTPGHE